MSLNKVLRDRWSATDIKRDMAARRASLQKLMVHEMEARIFRTEPLPRRPAAAAAAPQPSRPGSSAVRPGPALARVRG